MSKVHYGSVERGNESQPHDEWGPTICGLEYTESPMTDKWAEVTCKKCLGKNRAKRKYSHETIEQIQRNDW